MNHAETATPHIVRALPRLLIGLAILMAGLLWTLDNLDLVESEQVTRWWPAVVIAVGVIRLFEPTAGKVSSVLIMTVGTGLLLDTLDIWDFDLGDLVPMLIALLGAKLIVDVFRRNQARTSPATEPDSELHAFAFMSGVGRRSVATDFRGGDANAIMGGVELDLRDAKIREGSEAVLDVFAFWGGIEIRVPDNWRVVSQVLPLMGAYEDNTVNKNAAGGGQVLIIRGAAVMGGVEVKTADASTAR